MGIIDDRYSRQRLVAEIGDAGQARIAAKRVLIVGCGALGSTQALLLSRAGVGSLRLVDRDLVEISNLQRQLLYDEADVAAQLPKAEAAARHLRQGNSEIEIEPQVADLTHRNVEALLEGVDLVVDGTDNFETRLLVNDACVKHGITWVYGGAVASSGMAMLIRPDRGPCLRCLLGEQPAPGSTPTCDTLGVLNTLTATVAAMQVNLALRELVDAGAEAGQLHMLDAWRLQLRQVSVPRVEDCPCCRQRHFEFLSRSSASWATTLCGRQAVQITPPEGTRIDLEALATRLSAVGKIRQGEGLLQVEVAQRVLWIFPDGRTIVRGTADPAEARSLHARYVGI